MKKERIYISGPITGRDINEARRHFFSVERKLRKLGYHTINPLRMRLPVWLAQHGYYRLCLLIELVWLAYRADCIYMLKGWLKSGGAKAEQNLAAALGKTIMYQKKKNKTE